ncbi:hypothetical protein UA08_06658 [Talaromyces atroroseus]|uniref:Uncharacterized protein n=1 Tax=Talaromyces atroroseus TaxID=1441469 RepID=A0A225AAQ6_TALAT|nr:hypothetical protein UA08_06658 [Talaromyces atroroseus]OKL57962.1 hypothetical protein UA08_06658 [Talaromyces atroroseus]
MSTYRSTDYQHKPYDQISLPTKFHGIKSKDIKPEIFQFVNDHFYVVVGYNDNNEEPSELLHCGFYLCTNTTQGEGRLWSLHRSQERGGQWEISKSVLGGQQPPCWVAMKNLLLASYLCEVNMNYWEDLDRQIKLAEIDQSGNCMRWIDAVQEKLKPKYYTYNSLSTIKNEFNKKAYQLLTAKKVAILDKDHAGAEWQLQTKADSGV